MLIRVGSSTQTAIEQVSKRHPGLVTMLETCVLALNQEYIEADSAATLKDNDEIAIIPPISGG